MPSERCSDRLFAVFVLAIVAGCSGEQSALDSAGAEAAALERLTWILLAGGTAILALVMAATWYAVYRRPDKRRPVSSTALIVGGGLVFPIVVLTTLLVYGVGLTGALRAQEEADVHIHITGHMWWWDVRYRDSTGADIAVTANEIAIPVGRPVLISLASEDVIHSFWVPSLAGKLDLIPGRVTRMSVNAERPGTYRGQCAEFCGAQHALMAFYVVALEPEAFREWLERQRQPARASAGQRIFLAQGCGNCHTVRGVVDSRVPAPDLTHVGSRGYIGAGALKNTPENLRLWIAEGDRVKRGRRMPSFAHLDAQTLAALGEYLSGLQ